MPSCRHAVMLTICSLVAAACDHTMSMAERAKAHQVVSGRVVHWARAFANRNPDSLAVLYHHGRELAVTWHDGRQTVGWSEESAAQRAFLTSASQVNVTVRAINVDVLALDVAIARFSFAIDAEVGRRRLGCAGPALSVWVRETADDWRIRALQTACANSP